MKKQKSIKEDLQSLKTNRQFLAILILLFISVFFWIFINLISSQTREEVSAELTLLAKPLTPTIDKETLEEIDQKKSYSQEELQSFVIYKILLSRDGKTERIVPLDITIDDIEPIETVAPTPQPAGFSSLLQEELGEDDTESDQEASDSGNF